MDDYIVALESIEVVDFVVIRGFDRDMCVINCISYIWKIRKFFKSFFRFNKLSFSFWEFDMIMFSTVSIIVVVLTLKLGLMETYVFL